MVTEGLKKWREKQKPGAIMKPATFEEIARKAAMKKNKVKDPKAVAGAAYWKAAKASYKKYLKRKK
jgi:hypothetical protein